MVSLTGIFLRSSATGSVPSVGLASSSRPSSTAPLCRYRLNSHLLRLHRGATVGRFVRVVCPLLWFVSWLFIVGLPRDVSISYTGWHVGVDVFQWLISCTLFLWRNPLLLFCFCLFLPTWWGSVSLSFDLWFISYSCIFMGSYVRTFCFKVFAHGNI